MSYVKDSGVCFRCDESLYLSSRKLYMPFKRFDHGDHIIVTGHLSGCSLRRCKFPMISCHQCAFEY